MWLALVSLAFAAPARPCGTPELLKVAPPLARQAPALPAGNRAAGKAMRDAFGLENHMQTANFAVHWASQTPAQHVLDDLAAAFETAWAEQIGRMEHDAPLGTDTYLFNVYIGDSGEGSPDGFGAGGYYYVDSEGQPMIVIAWDSLFYAQSLSSTAYHEFYHAIQGRADRYPYEDPSAWYWEATAEWAAIETEPLNPSNGAFAFGYLLLPQLPVNFFDYADTGIIQEYHQYGAFLFAHDLTEQVGWELVRDTWMDSGTEEDPLEVMRAWLADRDLDLDELYLDHLAHNAVYDYEMGAAYRESVEFFNEWYYPDLDRVAIALGDEGGSGRALKAIAPHRYGATMIAVSWPIDGTLDVTVTGDAEGTEGSPARYGARVVQQWNDGTHAYTDVVFDGVTGTVTMPLEGTEEVVWLVVGAWTETWDGAVWAEEAFPFDYAITVTPPLEPPGLPYLPTEKEGPTSGSDCNCDSRGGGGGAWVAGLAALLLLRRRV